MTPFDHVLAAERALNEHVNRMALDISLGYEPGEGSKAFLSYLKTQLENAKRHYVEQQQFLKTRREFQKN